MGAIEDQANRAFLNYLIRRTVALVNEIRIVGTHPVTGQRADAEEPGTGCPIRWGGHHVVLTAGHVVENASANDLRIFSFRDSAVTFKSPSSVTREDSDAGFSLDDANAEIHVCGWEDLAVIKVDVDSFPHVEFVNVAEEWIDPPEGEMVHCCGFPSDHNVTLGKTVFPNKEEVDVGLIPTVFSGSVLPEPTEEELKFKITAFEASRHYLMPYNAAPMSEHPRGVSGAAAWWEPSGKETIWRPRLDFAGICVCTYKKGEVVQVVKASVVRQFLEEVFGPP